MEHFLLEQTQKYNFIGINKECDLRIESSMPQISNPTNYAKGGENAQNVIQYNKQQSADSQKSTQNAENRAQGKQDIGGREDIDSADEISGVHSAGAVDRLESSTRITHLEGDKTRITYGLKVIELMSDQEYQAFLWATQDLSESEKILMAQSLYRFTAFYQGKDSADDTQLDVQKLNAHKAFGVEHSMIEDFIQRYKNAYGKLMQTQFEG